MPANHTWANKNIPKIGMHTFAKCTLSIAFALSLILVKPRDVFQARGIVEFGETKIENNFPDGMRFSIKIITGGARGVVWFHYQLGTNHWYYERANCQAHLIQNEVEYYNCIYFLDLQNLPPQILVKFKWQLFGNINSYSKEDLVIYEDLIYQWKSLTHDHLTIQWHDHPPDFGEKLMIIAETSIKTQQSLLGMEMEGPLQIVIANGLEEYNKWKDEREYQSYGAAYPEYGLTVQIINDTDSEERIRAVIDHEISHIFFFYAVNHERTHPKWLDEGLAVYNEPGNHNNERQLIEVALALNKLIPLSELRDSFGHDNDRVSLAYAESLSAIEYLVDTYGEEGLTALFAQYQNGKNTEEAFLAAFGKTPDEFETAWLEQLQNQQFKRTNLFLFSYYALCACCFALMILTIGLSLAIVRVKKSNHKSHQQNRP